MDPFASSTKPKNRFLSYFQSRSRAQYIRAGIWGLGTALISGGLVLLFFAGLGWLVETLGPVLGLSSSEATQFGVVFGQLAHASILLPFWLLLLIFLLCGLSMLAAQSWKRCWRVLLIVGWVILLLPLSVLVLWFTQVNDLQTGIVLSSLFDMLGAGLL